MKKVSCSVKKHTLHFLTEAKTSRDSLLKKDVWYVRLSDEEGNTGIGEIAPLFGLSIESKEEVEAAIRQMVRGNVSLGAYEKVPSVKMGLEMAFLDLNSDSEQCYFASSFTQNINSQVINGLIWMGDYSYMRSQIQAKLDSGFTTIKLKIGAIDFVKELELLRLIRCDFGPEDITLRVDANGAFADDALDKLEKLAEYEIHSIEQPIKQGQWDKMARLCEITPVDIALDEELIGVHDIQAKRHLLDSIKPQYIILKPSLIGGFSSADDWIKLAQENDCGWWATSALESNVGLTAIAQWVSTKNNVLPQGLGTGQLFSNNSPSNLTLKGENLYCSVRQDLNFESFWNGLDSV